MKLKRRNKANAQFSMASLTDIIFLLLIFFIINSEMPNALKLLLPSASGKTVASQPISLSISEDLRYMVNNTEVSFGEIKNLLSSEINKVGSEETTIVLKIDKRVPLENVVEVLEIGNQLRVPMILSTKPTPKR
jgi:biopolymer transport protein ExbD